MRFRLLASLALLLPVLGCGDSVTGPLTLSASDTKLLYQELETVFSRAELDRTANLPSGSSSILLDRQTTVALTVQCSGGGTGNFSGTDNSNPSAAQYDVSVTFTKCQTDHYEITGSYHQVITNTANGLTTSIATTGTGDITVTVLSSGTSGTCHIDFGITVASGGITATGTFCGNAATGTLTS